MDPHYQLERVMARLDKELLDGKITNEEYREEMRALEADYRDSAYEAAQAEYGRWFE